MNETYIISIDLESLDLIIESLVEKKRNQTLTLSELEGIRALNGNIENDLFLKNKHIESLIMYLRNVKEGEVE